MVWRVMTGRSTMPARVTHREAPAGPLAEAPTILTRADIDDLARALRRAVLIVPLSPLHGCGNERNAVVAEIHVRPADKECR